MGLEPILYAMAAIQVVAALVMALFSIARGQWFAALGAVFGTAVGFSPFFVTQGPAVWGPVILIALASTAVLVVAYGISKKWKPLIATVTILVIPLVYRAMAYAPSTLPSAQALPFLMLLGEIEFLCGPIISALAGRELFGWLDHRRCCMKGA